MMNATRDTAICTLHDATSRERFGGKATNLSVAQELGFRVPATRVIASDVLADFVETTGLGASLSEYFAAFNIESNEMLMHRYDDLCRRVADALLPERLQRAITDAAGDLLEDAPGGLAVRSSAVTEDSATASFAGVFESYIGLTTPNQVIAHVKRVWCSLWAPKAVRYQRRMKIEPGMDGMAVLIQRVAQAIYSGVIHTADTATGNPWRFVLHATRGLSVDLLGGSGEGDQVAVDWETGAVLERQIGTKQTRLWAGNGSVKKLYVPKNAALTASIDDTSATQIAVVARQLDDAFATRLDIEWAVDHLGLVVIQVRPLTGLPAFFPARLSDQAEKKQWWASHFVAANRPEASFIPPLFSDVSGQELWTRYQPKEFVFFADPGKEEMDVCGYRYATVTKWRRFNDYIKGPEATESWMDAHEYEYRSRWLRFEDEINEVASDTAQAINGTTNALEIIPAVLRIRDRWVDLCSVTLGAPQSFGDVCEALFNDFCATYVGPHFDASGLLRGGADSFTCRSTSSLQALALSIDESAVLQTFDRLPTVAIIPHLQRTRPDCAFLQVFEQYCWKFGRRPPSWEARPALWRERGGHPKDRPPLSPEPGKYLQALNAIRRVLSREARDPTEMQRRAAKQRNERVKQARKALGSKDATVLARFDKIYEWALVWTQALNDRHAGEIAYYWLYELLWHFSVRLCDEGVLENPEDVLMFRRSDLEDSVARGSLAPLRRVFTSRKREYLRNRRLTPPRWLGVQPKVDYWEYVKEEQRARFATGTHSDGIFHGTGNNRGIVTGIAVKTDSVDDVAFYDSLSPENIVVLTTPGTSPFADWHSLLMVAKAIVSVGTPYHHLVQVANECGVPLIGSVEADLRIIPDRAGILVNSNTGEIRVLD